VQAAQLHHHEKQAERPRAYRDEEVLPLGPPAHPPQGNALIAKLSGLRHRRDAPVASGEDLGRLVDAAREGDRDALDDLVRATYGGTYTLAYRLTGNEDDARDVVQDAYLRAYRGLRRFRGDAQFTTWLYRITANCSANLLAKRARHRTEPLADDEPVIDLRPEVDPELRLAGSDDRARIAAALAELPWRLRQVIVLRDIYDLAHGAIAKELGITEAAAKVRLHRARRRLRDLLAAEGTEAGAGYATRVARKHEDLPDADAG
jgi:RNA polymerase sigma-70 factor (ECF subfamily)